MKLTGKRALVTGASRGVGRQIALGLAAEGCKLVLHGRKAEHLAETLELLRPYGVEVEVAAAELAAPEETDRLIANVLSRFGGVDILYNNAAVSVQGKPICDFGEDEWKALFQVNVFSLVKLCNAFAPGMEERGYGRIVNLSSGIKDQPQYAPYSVSKAAVDKFTQDLSYAFKDSAVRVNFLDPGWLRTDLGGPNADNEVTTVLPGALAPVLIADDGPTGQHFSAQAYRS